MRKGFTFIEILIVLSILAVSFSIAFPALSRFSARLSLNGAANTLASDFRSLQSRAVLQHKTLALAPEEVRVPSGIKVLGSSLISFSSSGFTPPGGSGTWILGNRFGDKKKIIVSTFGRVRLE